MIGHLTVYRLKQKLIKELYGGMGQDIRVEWITIAGGTTDVIFDVVDSGTETKNVLKTKGLFVDKSRDLSRTVENAVEHQYDMAWLIETDINLKNREDFIIAQLLQDEYYSGSGTGASSTWTDSGASWTDDQWIGFFLIFDDKRFEITDNTATTLTVQLGGQTLPASDSYEICGIKEWFPVVPAPTLGDAFGLPMGTGQGLQYVYCTQVPMKGA